MRNLKKIHEVQAILFVTTCILASQGLWLIAALSLVAFFYCRNLLPFQKVN